MQHDIEPLYNNHWENITPQADDSVIAFVKNEPLVTGPEDDLFLPSVEQFLGLIGKSLDDITDGKSELIYLFSVDDSRFFLSLDDESIKALYENTPEGFSFLKTVNFRGMTDRVLSFVCAVAMHLNTWYRDNKFCGRCGTPTIHDSKERMMRCPECGNMIFPKICPGVIVGIIHDGKLLMSRYVGRPYTAHALIAGFTEIGEPIEDTVHREVLEEVGLKVKNVTFYGSQPWPPSSSLLVGFFCELDGDDEITIDETELADADWYDPADVPGENDNFSLTRDMMVFFHDHYDQPELMIHKRK